MADPKHVTLTANEVETVTLDVRARTINVLNEDGAAAVYFNINSSTDPAVGADGCWMLPATKAALDVKVGDGAGHTVVKLISTGTPTVQVGPVS